MLCFYKCCTSWYTTKKEARSFSKWKINGLWWSLVTQNCFGLRLSKESQIRVRVEDNLWFQELHDRTVLCVHFSGRHERKTFYTREGSNVKSQYQYYTNIQCGDPICLLWLHSEHSGLLIKRLMIQSQRHHKKVHPCMSNNSRKLHSEYFLHNFPTVFHLECLLFTTVVTANITKKRNILSLVSFRNMPSH